MSIIGKKILLVTSTNLTCNPRCLKELQLLLQLKAKVTVVAFNLHNWTNDEEEQIKNKFPQVDFIYLNATKNDNFFPWFTASVVQKISALLLLIFSKNVFFNAMACSKSNWMLYRFFKQATLQANLLIAHNPAAFYAAAFYTNKNKIPLAIDVEDYHPGESNQLNWLSKAVSIVMLHVLPKCVYTSYAAPLIKKYTQQLVPNKLHNAIVINNSFSTHEFALPMHSGTNDLLQIVWFSQYIDYGRGLEMVLPILDSFSSNISLTLIGNSRQIFYDKEIANRKYIICKPAMPHLALQQLLSNYDIGLAIEDASANLNRNICLTNKIWSYFQAGLFIVATNTDAQNLFMQQHPNHGVIATTEKYNLMNAITEVIKNKEQIKSNKIVRFNLAKTFNWDNESHHLATMWEEVIS